MQRRVQRVRTLPDKAKKNIEFLSNTGPDSLKNHKATKQACSAQPSSARQRNVSGHWRADDGLLIVVFGSSHP